jgi:hypothetical protein
MRIADNPPEVSFIKSPLSHNRIQGIPCGTPWGGNYRCCYASVGFDRWNLVEKHPSVKYILLLWAVGGVA